MPTSDAAFIEKQLRYLLELRVALPAAAKNDGDNAWVKRVMMARSVVRFGLQSLTNDPLPRSRPSCLPRTARRRTPRQCR